MRLAVRQAMRGAVPAECEQGTRGNHWHANAEIQTSDGELHRRFASCDTETDALASVSLIMRTPTDGMAAVPLLPTCFLCLEGHGELLKVCKCSSRVHGACFRQIVLRVPSHHHKCPICLSKYTVDVGFRQKECKSSAAEQDTSLCVFSILYVGLLSTLVVALDVLVARRERLDVFFAFSGVALVLISCTKRALPIPAGSETSIML